MRRMHGLLLLLSACGGNNGGGGGADLSQRLADLATRAADLSAAPDMARPPDLSPPADLAPPMVTGLPQNCAAGTTAQTLYTTVVQNTCAIDSCHGAKGSVHYSITSVATMKTAWVNVPADQADSMNRVTPGNVNQSYVLYKLTNEQGKAAQADAAGAQMPLVGSPLSSADLCLFISWIQGGAN